MVRIMARLWFMLLMSEEVQNMGFVCVRFLLVVVV